MSQSYFGWGIEIDDYDRRFLVGIGYSPTLTGKPADFGHVVRTLTFATRIEARAALARYRKASDWAFKGVPINKGGNRIYRNARVVRLAFTVAALP
jgi:hypothetical protein